PTIQAIRPDMSGSHTSVSGPAAGLTAVVAAQIVVLGSFQTFLLAVVLAGLIQIVLGVVRAGSLAAFFPSSVIKGLLAAIGVILILKQIPHVVGHDPDPEGDMAFAQPDHQNTFTELAEVVNDLHPGAVVIGLLSIAVLVLWDRVKALKTSLVPAPLVVVLLGVGLSLLFRQLGGRWGIGDTHLVQVPVAESPQAFFNLLQFPDFAALGNAKVYLAAATIAAVASLETLLNLQAVDRIDPRQRTSPPSRELWAQGVGNVASGLIGGLPVTSVIVRSSVNINAGARSRVSAVWHGLLLLACVAALPTYLNEIPLACLAAILLVTGVKLASPALVRQMWAGGRYQFIPFVITVAAIVLTDLLVGVVIGLAVSLSFILWSNLRRPVRTIVERHLGGEVVHIELASQVSFLNRAALDRTLDAVPAGGHVLIDATGTDYIDPDILDLIHDFDEVTGPARGIEVSLKGFRAKYALDDRIQYADYSTRELQSALTPAQALQILKDGHERFRTNRRLSRDLGRLVHATAAGQHPFAVVLSCIDSRTPAEIIFDVGVGDIFVVRLAGNVTSRKALGSIEYACAVAGAKLIVVMGHTRCGAVGAAIDLIANGKTAAEATGCEHLDYVVQDVQQAVDAGACKDAAWLPTEEKEKFVTSVARQNVARGAEALVAQSGTLARLVHDGKIAVVGAMYDVVTGAIEFLPGAGAEAARPTAVVSSRDTLSSARAEAVAAPGPAGPRL
ncbi:MAG TPA: SulP family inorganic anion transporter, partial [Gemmataceae bacterium]|nr:SulP family inorganic anion transporter [Gemmataceae bacterium]